MTEPYDDGLTDYQRMMLRAVILKRYRNRSVKKRSKRDDIRQYNEEHAIQLKLRPQLNRKDYPWVAK